MASASGLTLPYPWASITQDSLRAGVQGKQSASPPPLCLYRHPPNPALLTGPISSQIFLIFALGRDWHICPPSLLARRCLEGREWHHLLNPGQHLMWLLISGNQWWGGEGRGRPKIMALPALVTLSWLCPHTPGWTERTSEIDPFSSFPSFLPRMLSRFSRVWLFVTPRTVARQAPLSMGLSKQEYWSGLQCPPAGDLPDPGIKYVSVMPPALAGEFFTTSAT